MQSSLRNSLSNLPFADLSPEARELRKAIFHPKYSKDLVLASSIWVLTFVSYVMLRTSPYTIRECFSYLLVPFILNALFSLYSSRSLDLGVEPGFLEQEISSVYAKGGVQAVKSAAEELKYNINIDTSTVVSAAFCIPVGFAILNAARASFHNPSVLTFLAVVEVTALFGVCACIIGICAMHYQNKIASQVHDLSAQEVHRIHTFFTEKATRPGTGANPVAGPTFEEVDGWQRYSCL